MRSFAILRDHESLRLIVDHFNKPSRFPPLPCHTHQDATCRNTFKYPSNCHPTIRSVSIDPRSLHGSRMHSDFTCRCSLHQCHRLPGDVRLARCTQCQSSVLELNLVGHQRVRCSRSHITLPNVSHPDVSSSSVRDGLCLGSSRS